MQKNYVEFLDEEENKYDQNESKQNYKTPTGFTQNVNNQNQYNDMDLFDNNKQSISLQQNLDQNQDQPKLVNRKSTILLQEQFQTLGLQNKQIPCYQLLISNNISKDCAIFLIISEKIQNELQVYDQLASNDQDKWCPNQSCTHIIRLKNKGQQEIQCEQCGTIMCCQCNRIQHPGLTCQQVLDIEINQIANSNNIQRCKKCHTLVEKITGCNVMKCEVCHYEFCWICNQEFTPLHYAPFNPFGCPMLLNEKYGKMGGCKILLYKIGIVLLFILLLPFLLILVGPIGGYKLIQLYIQKREYSMAPLSTCATIGFYCLFIFLGIILDPIIWAILIIGFIPAIIYLWKINSLHRENLQIRESQQIQNGNDILVPQKIQQMS
ncbi:hypothetical protein PPERSA_04414 [Pseudocohnilembus persalinus]|uniref:RBR-type E3 ubiquitin transferase n=1 Tax=Pseudocohnilembus persalinus TaxID=266149 RepID=A0A0V0QR30_PSEPJ|nr:hypothetical protein PPERSA_04414 [Pseudocohnilembus persalinus]|eukprot:KRX04599.1 hypothetical protein PPERSA_04414 [Pseudocohnilembus persalinus]